MNIYIIIYNHIHKYDQTNLQKKNILRNVLKSGKKVKINKSTLGIELEVYFLVKKSFFLL